MKPSPGGATCHLLLSPPTHCFAVILSPGRGATGTHSDGARAVTWPMTSQLFVCMSRDLSMEAAILFCCHVVLRWYGHQGRTILFWSPDGAVGQGQRSKVTDLFYWYNCQLGLGLITLIMSSVVNPNTNPNSTSKRTCSKNGYVTVRINTDDYGALFETCLGTEPVSCSFFSSFLERSNDVMEFSTLKKRNTIPHFHPASRLKPSGRKFGHAAGKT